MNGSDSGLAVDRAGIADYHFLRVLGTGNHGVFYLASRPDRLRADADLVAVKVLSGSNSQDTFRRATRELAAFAAVRSPYLVTLYDAGQQGDDLYYSMEYLPDGSLADAAGSLPAGQALAAVADAARAADALHEAGIAHNDIKPRNIMLHASGAKLSDLGLSQLLSPGLTITGLGPAGSVEFLDPAIIRGEVPSRATDIYALGASLHRVLTGPGPSTATCRQTTPWWRCGGCSAIPPRSQTSWLRRSGTSSPARSTRTRRPARTPPPS